MKNIFKILTILSVAIFSGTLVCGCHESYISPDYVSPYDDVPYETIIEGVPVIMAMSDPFFVSVSRGMGAIASDNTNREKAIFNVYSFLTNNSVYEGGPDYTRTYKVEEELPENEPMYCLIDDPETGMGAQMKLVGDDVLSYVSNERQYFYSQRNQDYKYNFFVYHIDDAEINGGVVREKDNIHLDIRIDGTQDIMYGAADITQKQISDVHKDQKWLLNRLYDKDLVFSTITGHRAIHPVFEAKHAMSRFTFNLVGEDALKDQVYIQDIYVMAQRDWRLTVAADDKSKLGFPKPEEQGYVREEEIHLCDDSGDNGGVPSLDNDKYIIRKGEVIPNLGGIGLLLPPRERYDLYIKCAYKAPNGKEYKYMARYNLTNRNEDTGKEEPFKAGCHYKVTMHVFGFSEIQMSFNGLSWGDPIDIPIGEDDIDFLPNYK
ncbi:MAG: hypothetical protein IKA52_01375 [Bacteroidaceae bacterium]|nr:hypothetical protein [Bacteroidaceae bacterium]